MKCTMRIKDSLGRRNNKYKGTEQQITAPRSNPVPTFVNKVLLQHIHAHLFIYCLYIFLALA